MQNNPSQFIRIAKSNFCLILILYLTFVFIGNSFIKFYGGYLKFHFEKEFEHLTAAHFCIWLNKCIVVVVVEGLRQSLFDLFLEKIDWRKRTYPMQTGLYSIIPLYPSSHMVVEKLDKNK
jgi:hypothetical protein